MSVGRKRHHGGDAIIGSCYACGGPCTRNDSTRVKDRTVGVRRLVHRGSCQERVEMFGPPVILGGPEEGSNDG